jgi:chromosome segregation ATPase|tara:strand:- start:146 stop:571 length:426 start_codon:yes stop_codon:yes gene_type:complete
MENGNNLKELIKDIAVLKADRDTSGQVHQRLDDAITRLTDISAGIKSMLAVHEEKLRRVDTSQDDLFSILEDRRREWEDDLKDLHSRISTQSRDLREAIDQVTNRLDSRVGVLERWRWLIIGGAILLGFILQGSMDMGFFG